MADKSEGHAVSLDRVSSWMTKRGPVMHTRSFCRSSTLNSTYTALSELSEIQGVGTLPSLTPEESQRQNILISLIVGDEIVKGSLEKACSWYSSYLQSKFNSHWCLLAQALVGLDCLSLSPRPGDLVVIYDFVIAVAELLKSRENLALVEIVDELDNRDTLKSQLDEERAVPNQIIFAALGWLSMLYEAVPDPKVDKLEVTKTSTSSSGRRNALATKKYCTFRQGFEHIDLPIYSMLGRFGDLVPGSRMTLCLEQDLSGCPTRDVILVQSACFNTMYSLAELKIEWVSSLTLHLELDSGRKSLKLFQFPSFCRIMAAENNNNFLSRLLNDHAIGNSEDVSTPKVLTGEFFEEILLSYRLLFGQDTRSWKAFSWMVALEGQGPRIGSWACDPLLFELCGKSCKSDEARIVYDDIDANEPISYYDPHDEFPFFGRRLLELQQFVQQHQPQNVKSLFNDRRDVAAWYNLWNNQILVLFATLTIILMILSLIFQIWQVIIAKGQS